MIQSVMDALKHLSPVRPEGLDAGKLPILTVRSAGEGSLCRADGRDYARTVRCQVDIFAKSWEEAEKLASDARRILTQPPWGYCMEALLRSYDETMMTYRVSARYRAAEKIKEI